MHGHVNVRFVCKLLSRVIWTVIDTNGSSELLRRVCVHACVCVYIYILYVCVNVCVCVCIYIYIICMCVCVYIYIYIYIICMCECMCVYIYIYIYYMYVWMYVCVCIYIYYMYAWMCVCLYIYISYVCVCVYIYILYVCVCNSIVVYRWDWTPCQPVFLSWKGQQIFSSTRHPHWPRGPISTLSTTYIRLFCGQWRGWVNCITSI